AGGKVARLIRELRPRVVVTENDNGTYGHPDHVMCHRVTMRAWDLAGDPAAPVDGAPWQPARLYAMAAVTEGWDEIVQRMRAEGLDTAWLEAMIERRREHVPPVSPADVTAAIDVSDYAETQRRALLCHRTQIAPDNFLMGLPPNVRRLAFGVAYLMRLRPTPAPGERDADLIP
ncbi:MAG: PIG-L family deacetylase, partial [Chloroflexi bacterium]|nr:PIG-L family deacetylase [Chloroflexota bacterium]